MIHIIKNNKWVITSSLTCIVFGLLTFFTFINRSFISLTDKNLQILPMKLALEFHLWLYYWVEPLHLFVILMKKY